MTSTDHSSAVSGGSPLTPAPAPLTVQDAFDAHYAGLVEELTDLCGSPVAAEAGVDEAFLRAASNPEEFDQIGRQREWLLVIARNHVMRKQFRRDDLDPASASTLARFQRPTLGAALDRARQRHRKSRTTTAAGAAAAVLMIVGATVLTAPAIADWRVAGVSTGTRLAASAPPAGRSTAAAANRSDTAARRTPTPSRTPIEAWPPSVDAIVSHADSRSYSIVSPDTPGTRATVWTRCRSNPRPDEPSCQGDNRMRAVEVADAQGRRSRHYLVEGQGVVPGFDGHFVITGWDGNFTLISPTMPEPRAFAVKHGGVPRRGMSFTNCGAAPCTLDAHGTVTFIDLPNAESWHWNTSHGWIGHTAGGTYSSAAEGPKWTVFVQQPKGSFASVEVTARDAVSHEDAWLRAFMGPGDEAVVTLEGPANAMVAISTNHGRTWQYRWALGLSETLPIDWLSWPVAKDPIFKVSAFKPMR